jgi:uncharacterized protein
MIANSARQKEALSCTGAIEGSLMTEYIILPGSGGSGETHWQTHWERANPDMRRFAPASWDLPDFKDWLAALEIAVAESATPPVLVAHSLACLLVAHWQRVSTLPVRGAMLVAVPDPASAVFPSYGASFAAAAQGRLRFSSLVVTSADDPYGSVAYARAKAAQWGSDIRIVGALGHIGSAARLGDWPQGLALLRDFVAKT